MKTRSSYQWRNQVVWGLFLMVLGAAIFADHLNLFDITDLWHYAPLVFVVFGLNKLIGYPTSDDMLSGVGQILFGAWLYAVIEGLYDLTVFNSWPLIIVWWGLKLVLRPAADHFLAKNKEHQNV